MMVRRLCFCWNEESNHKIQGLAGMRVSFGNYVQRVGLQAIATLSPALQTVGASIYAFIKETNAIIKDPKTYVETLITVYKDNEQLVDVRPILALQLQIV